MNVTMEGNQHDERRASEPAAYHVPPASIPAQSIERLTKAIEQLNRTNTYWYAFWHGLVGGISSTVGVALVIWLIFWLLGRLNFIPGLADVAATLHRILQKP